MWRVGRDGCLYGEDFLIVKVGGGNTANIVNYYFGRTYIAPQDVSQELFNFNLTAIQAQMNSADIQTLVADLQSVLGQALVSTASASDQVALNALQPRITALSNQLTTVNNSIQVCRLDLAKAAVEVKSCLSVAALDVQGLFRDSQDL